MSTYLTDMKADIRGILKDDPSSTADYQLSDTELGTIISEQALLRFSFDHPYVTADGVSATGVVAVEALSGTYSSSPYIKRVKCFRFLYQSPETTETFMMEYTTLHTLTETTITIDTAWRAAFKYLCAVVCAEHLSHKYGYWSDSSLGADIVDYSAKADYWRSRAKDLIVVYKSFSGEEKDVAPASAKGEYDISLPWGTDHVFHPRKWRRARVFEKGPGTKYIEVLEKGRRPGKRFPPPDPIRLWLRRTDKGKAFVQKIQEKYKLPYDKALERATYLKSMGIAKYGTIAVRMFRTVYKMGKQWAINKVERDIANWTKR